MPTILVTGANRGLGLEFVRQYAADGWRVHAACRVPGAAAELDELSDGFPDVAVHVLDVASASSIAQLAGDLDDEPIDVLLNNAGLFGPKQGAESDPRQSLGAVDAEIWLDVLRVNTVAPLLVAQAFVDHVAASELRRIVTISSELGSIAGTAGGLYAYRTSKAAVNMAMASLAKDVSDRDISVALFCPGWVSTDMGGPDAPLDAEESVAHLRARIAAMTRAMSGGFWLHDGTPIPW